MRISIVTPCLNQIQMLRSTLASIQSQENCDVEHIVVDGGSSDGTRELLEAHDSEFSSWVSEPDGGAYDAINKGMRRATGEVMGWLNASDLYTPWTLATVKDIFTRFPEVQWITSLRPLCVDQAGRFAGMPAAAGFTREGLVRGRIGVPGGSVYVQQESTFWRRSLWEAVGSEIPAAYSWAGDLALWAEFLKHAPVYGVNVPLAAFRYHGGQRSESARYTADVVGILLEHRREPVVPHQFQYGIINPQFVPEGKTVAWECELREGGHPGTPPLETIITGLDTVRHVDQLQEAVTAYQQALNGYIEHEAARLKNLETTKETLEITRQKLALKRTELHAAKEAIKRYKQREKERTPRAKRSMANWLGRLLRRGQKAPAITALPTPSAFPAIPPAERAEASAPLASSVEVLSIPPETTQTDLPTLPTRRRIWVAHHSAAQNIGDRACDPFRYLPLPPGVDVELRTLSLTDKETIASLSNEIIVLGGGGLLNLWCRDSVMIPLLMADNTVVAWGIGHHHDHVYKTDDRPWKGTIKTMTADYAILNHFTLAGVRDYNNPWDYVPCPTCLHPAFDNILPQPVHDAVIYEHAEAGSIPIDDFPKRNNHGPEDLADIVQFLALGRTVITNSFHGAYWALLMGRNVIIYEPWCSKFYTFREPLTTATKENWREQLLLATGIPGYLEESRTLNHAFAARFWEKLDLKPV